MIFFRRGHPFDPNWEMTPSLRWLIWTSGWRGALVLFSFAICGLAWWRGPQVYNQAKVWRAERLVAESVSAREKGDFTDADSKLRQAVVLLQRHPITLRAVANHKLALHDLSALNIYAELMATGEATDEDKVVFCRQSFRLGQPKMAATVLEELKSTPGRRTAALLSLLAEESAGDGHWSEAVKLARQSCASEPVSDQDKAYAKSVLARLLLQPTATAQDSAFAAVSEAIDLLSSLALRGDNIGGESIELLISLSHKSETASFFLNREVRMLMSATERYPRATAALKVNVWDLRLAAEPTKRKEIVREFFEHFKNDLSPDLRLEAARWLNRKGMHGETLEMAGPSKLESRDWFLLYLDAMAALGRWEDVLTTLTDENHTVPLVPALRKLFEFRCQVETGRHPDIASSWREIQIALRNEKGDDQLYVAGYAEQIGLPNEAAQTYQRLLTADAGVVPAEDKLDRTRRLACYIGLLRTGAKTMTLDDLGELMGSFAQEFPEMDEVQNDNAYLQLLAGRNIEEAAKMAHKLSEKKPELLAYRTTLALAALRRKDITAAVAVYDGWTIDWSTAQDRYKAVYAAVMRAARRPIEADMVASTINKEALRFEEIQLAGTP